MSNLNGTLVEPSQSPTHATNDDIISSLSEAQDKTLSLVPIFSGLLSAWGSANIIYMVYKSEHWNSYKRIMLGLSVFDLISSIAIALQAFWLPADTSQRIYAVGTDATCTLGGFFQQLSLANIWYNGFLSFYFLLTIRYQVSEQRMSRWYEPPMHIIAIGHPLITAIVGAALGAYGELGVGHYCWLSDYPEGCYGCQGAETVPPGMDGAECCKTPLLAYIFAAIPSFLVLLAVILNNILIYCYVRRVVRQSIYDQSKRRYSQPTANGGSTELQSAVTSNYGNVSSDSAPLPPPDVADTDDEAKTPEDHDEKDGAIATNRRDNNTLQPTIKLASDNSIGAAPEGPEDDQDKNVDAVLTTSDHPTPKELSGGPLPVPAGVPLTRIDEEGRTTSGESIISNDVSRVLKEEKVREDVRHLHLQQLHDDRQKERLKAVAVQAFLYVGGFLLTQLPLIVMGIMASGEELTAADDADLFPVMLLRSILWPLQGFFNYFIWIRSPTYLRET